MKATVKRLVWLEVLLFISCVVIALFLPFNLHQQAVLLLCLWMLSSEFVYAALSKKTQLSGLALGPTGLRFDNFMLASRVLWIVIIVAAALVFVGVWFQTAQLIEIRLKMFRYPISTLLQELALQVFLFRRLLLLLPSRRAILVNGLVFSLCHIPNFPLMTATLIMGWFLSYWYFNYRCVYPLWVAHLILGASFSMCAHPSAGLTKVGGGYLVHHYPWWAQVYGRKMATKPVNGRIVYAQEK